MLTDNSLKQVVAQSINQGGPGAGGLIFEAFKFATDTETIFYGAGADTYAAGNAKYIRKFLGGIAMPYVDDDDNTMLVISSTDNNDDTVTITSETTTPVSVLVWGVGAVGTPV